MSEQEFKDELKNEIHFDLQKYYYKMNLRTIITIVGSTISLAGVLMGGIIWLKVTLSDHSNLISNNSKSIEACLKDKHDIWDECYRLDKKIEVVDNNLINHINAVNNNSRVNQ